MNALVIPQSFGALSTRFADAPIDNTLSAGIPASFGVIGFKGKVWSIRYRGTTTHLLSENGRDPAFSIELVLLKSSPFVSKTFYERAYVEGSADPPDCMSMNGVVPDASSPKKQAPACATCPNNQWGSRLTPDGKAAKACADNKRLAVGLMPNLLDEQFGGPLLLRVPPTSLQDMASYGNLLAQHGYPENALVTRVSFDMREAYPRFQFQPVRALTDAEADASIMLRESGEVSRILSEALEYGGPQESPPAAEQAQQPQPKPQPQQPFQPASQASQTAAVPAQTQTEQSIGQRAVAARAAAGPTPPRPTVVRTLTLQPNAQPQTAQPAQQPQPQPQPQQPQPQQQAVPASPTPPLHAVPAGVGPAVGEEIPAFLRRDQPGAQPAEDTGDAAFMDEIDAKLAAMLPG